MNPKRNRARDIGFYILLLLILAAVIFTMTRDSEPASVEKYSDLVDLFNQEKVQSFRTEGNKIILQLRTDDPAQTEEKVYDLYSFNVFYEDFHELVLEQHHLDRNGKISPGSACHYQDVRQWCYGHRCC